MRVCVEREKDSHTDIIITITHCQMKNEHYIFSLQAQRSIQPTNIEGVEQGIEANSALNPGKIISVSPISSTPFIIISKIYIST